MARARNPRPLVTERMHMDEFERWFLVVYTIYIIASILALWWVGRDRDDRKLHLISGRALRERIGGKQ